MPALLFYEYFFRQLIHFYIHIYKCYNHYYCNYNIFNFFSSK